MLPLRAPLSGLKQVSRFFVFRQKNKDFLCYFPFYSYLCGALLINQTMESLFDICGLVGSIGLVLGYLPQAIQTIRTRNTDGISLPGFIMMAVGAFGFLTQGLISANYYIMLTNFITFVCSVIIFGIKMYNDYFKKP